MNEEEKLLDEMKKLIGHGIATMDESGRRNQEGNSYMLWEVYWNELRVDMCEAQLLIEDLRSCIRKRSNE